MGNACIARALRLRALRVFRGASSPVAPFTLPRHRLIGESRLLDGTHTVYNLAYDRLGNRTRQTNYVHDRFTCYLHDTNRHGEAWNPNRYPVVTEQRRYMLGDGIEAQEDLAAQPPSTVFLHGDLISSTMLTTDETGQPVPLGGMAASAVSYTAFGEPVTSGGVGQPPPAAVTRYQYAGGYGYESGLITLQGANTTLPPITLQHVGERWYQPGIGRFVQRDPIGLRGGFNVYTYCANNPLVVVDPRGLSGIDDGDALSGLGVLLVLIGEGIVTAAVPTPLNIAGGSIAIAGTAAWGRKDLAALGKWCIATAGNALPPPAPNPNPVRKRGMGGSVISGTPPFVPHHEYPEDPYPPEDK